MEENIASLLCYALWWVTGLIFFFIDKRPKVRFHAAQSIVVFGGLHIIEFILGRVLIGSLWAGGWASFSTGVMILDLIWLAAAVLWILLMVKAYQGQMFRVPVAANIADALVGKVNV